MVEHQEVLVVVELQVEEVTGVPGEEDLCRTQHYVGSGMRSTS